MEGCGCRTKMGINRWKGLFRVEDGNDLDIAGLRGRALQDPNVDITVLCGVAARRGHG